jgi:GNAT superfamily N-acetyltransferase
MVTPDARRAARTQMAAADFSLEELVAARFAHDERGRLAGPAPALYLVRSADGAVVRCHARLPDDVAKRLRAIAERPRGRPRAWAREYGAYLDALAKVAPISAMRAGPLYLCPPNLPGRDSCVRLGPDNADLLEGGELEEWIPDARAGMLMMAVVEDGRAVSLCASVHASADFHHAGVETAPSWRGRGLADRAVAAWAERVRVLGATPLYSTTFDNLASQTVARRLGLALIASEFEVELAGL